MTNGGDHRATKKRPRSETTPRPFFILRLRLLAGVCYLRNLISARNRPQVLEVIQSSDVQTVQDEATAGVVVDNIVVVGKGLVNIVR